MITMGNDQLSVSCLEDGTHVVLNDQARSIRWQLDERTRCYHRASETHARLLGRGHAIHQAPHVIQQTFDLAGERIVLRWELQGDELAITLSEATGGIAALALPGSFVPQEPAPLRLALPVMQGLLYDGRGEPFEQALPYQGHEGLSMAMIGYLAPRGGLLVSIEDWTDWTVIVGKHPTGAIYAYTNEIASLGTIRYPRAVRLAPTAPNLTALCKRYRNQIQKRGIWKPWEEKIAERPVVEHLFGALIAFIGYNQGALDYVSACRGLRAMGFERVFLYPVRMNAYTLNFEMGGDRPIALSDEALRAIKALGYDIAPWNWVFEALDDGSEAIRRGLRRDASSAFVPGWKLDNLQWYHCCTPFQTTFIKQSYEGAMREMTWAHFDVNASIGPLECYAQDHPWHRGQALDRRSDLQYLRELLGPQTNGNRVVSSEGFRDCLADIYDIGSTKLLPAFGDAPFWTVPMTMLVYHDSVIHDWWEVHNYNPHGGFDHISRLGRKSAGFPREKAAMDALYGCPPNVFPFGRQYRWVDFATRRTESYSTSLQDPSVQEALRIALPVCRLHRHIGMQEMLAHEFLSEDGAVQATTFADGTQVIANFVHEARETDGVGRLDPVSWRTV